MGCRVGGEIDFWAACMRRASSAPALIEQDDPIDVGIKVPPPACGTAGTRSAMEDERGLAGGIAARLPIDLVPVTGIEHPVIVGFYVLVQFGHGHSSVDLATSSLGSPVMIVQVCGEGAS